jgi:DNA modification methylase
MAERKSIRITCQGKGTVQLESVLGIQGNLKKISRVNLEKLKGRILKRGFNVPYHIWIHGGKNHLLDGHQRTKALLELQAQGYRVPPLPYDEIHADSMKDARDALLGIASQYGEFTMGGLREFTVGMEIDADLRLPAGEIRLGSINAAEETGIDDVPAAAPRISKPGDEWILGAHFLIVGDARDPVTFKALLASERAQLCFTDPPYGIEYDGSYRGGTLGSIKGDSKKPRNLGALLVPALRLAYNYSLEDAAFYIWHASGNRQPVAQAMATAGLQERQYIIWVKPAIVMGRMEYHYQYEPCFYAGKGNVHPRWTGDRTESTRWMARLRKTGEAFTNLSEPIALSSPGAAPIYIAAQPPKRKVASISLGPKETLTISVLEGGDVWEIAPDRRKDYQHPNQKPVELARRAINNHTEPGEIVVDPFAGSGSTLMAAELTGRRARCIELDPRFTDVIIKRWCLYLHAQNQKPEVQRNGKPYSWEKFCPEL